MTTPDLAGLCERLRAPSNWLMQPRGKDWKSVVNQYDRAPFEAAAAIESLVGVLEGLGKLRALISDSRNPDRVRIAGEWFDGPLATAYITLIEEVSETARTALEGASDDR